MTEELITDLPTVLLEVSLLLGGAVLVGLVALRINIPLTVVLAVTGLVVSEAGMDLQVTGLVRGEGLKELLVNLFLPVLIFEAALGLSTREFMRNLLAITALATVAVVISAALVGIGLNLILGVPIVAALLFGALISATDPVAVVAVFRELGVPKRLLTLVEGESLLNDGVAIVLYEILLVGALGGALSVADGALDFVVVFLGGIMIGSVVGTAAVMLLPVLPRLSAAALSVAVAYGSFVLAEGIVGVSGVMATVAAGVAIGGLVESRAQQAVRDLLHELWDALGFIANALLFLFIGLALNLDLIRENLDFIGVGVAAVLVSRPLAVIPVVGLLERLFHISKVGHRNSAVVIWGGLRGGVALALALALPLEFDQRDLFIAMTGGVVLATLLVNATTISLVVHYLGLDTPSQSDEYLGGLARLLAVQAARGRLERLGFEDELVEAHLNVAEADAPDQPRRSQLRPEEEGNVLTLRGLHIEREAYQSLSDAGLLPPIAARRLAARKAAEELELFKTLPNVDAAHVDQATRTFAHWEQSASSRLDERGGDVDRVVLHRRQAKALTRIAAVEGLRAMV